MIVVDIEASGVDFEKCGIIQIGALELENPKNIFLGECRVEEEYEFIFEGNWKGKKPEETLGKTEEELRDKRKKSEKELLKEFFDWCCKINFRTFICQHPQFDHAFLEQRARKYGLKFPTSHRAIDLHSIAFLKYLEIKKDILIKEGESDMGLKSTLNFIGMKDERNFHNALEDARLTAEAFSRLVYGKNLLPEFKNFKVPDYLFNGSVA